MYALRRYNSSCITLYAVHEKKQLGAKIGGLTLSLEVNGSRRWCYGWFALAMPWPTFAAWTSSFFHQVLRCQHVWLAGIDCKSICYLFWDYVATNFQVFFSKLPQVFERLASKMFPNQRYGGRPHLHVFARTPLGSLDANGWCISSLSSFLTWVRKQNILVFRGLWLVPSRTL